MNDLTGPFPMRPFILVLLKSKEAGEGTPKISMKFSLVFNLDIFVGNRGLVFYLREKGCEHRN